MSFPAAATPSHCTVIERRRPAAEQHVRRFRRPTSNAVPGLCTVTRHKATADLARQLNTATAAAPAVSNTRCRTGSYAATPTVGQYTQRTASPHSQPIASTCVPAASCDRPIDMTAHRGNRMTAWSVAQLDFATGAPHGRASRVLRWSRKGCSGRRLSTPRISCCKATRRSCSRRASCTRRAGHSTRTGETATGDSRFDAFRQPGKAARHGSAS